MARTRKFEVMKVNGRNVTFKSQTRARNPIMGFNQYSATKMTLTRSEIIRLYKSFTCSPIKCK